MAKSGDTPDPKLWPFEAIVDLGEGATSFHQYARDNGDGTVTVIEFHKGFGEVVYSREIVNLSERPSEKAERWYALYNKTYCPRD
jgi:hypothetical protein